MSRGRSGDGEEEPYARRPGDDLVEPLFGALPRSEGETREDDLRPGLFARLRRRLSLRRPAEDIDGEDWFTCPVCGVEVRAGAPSCRECGSDAQTGWSDATELDDLDLPEPPTPRIPDTFEEFTRDPSARRGPSPRLLLALLVAALILIAARGVVAILAG